MEKKNIKKMGEKKVFLTLLTEVLLLYLKLFSSFVTFFFGQYIFQTQSYCSPKKPPKPVRDTVVKIIENDVVSEPRLKRSLSEGNKTKTTQFPPRTFSEGQRISEAKKAQTFVDTSKPIPVQNFSQKGQVIQMSDFDALIQSFSDSAKELEQAERLALEKQREQEGIARKASKNASEHGKKAFELRIRKNQVLENKQALESLKNSSYQTDSGSSKAETFVKNEPEKSMEQDLKNSDSVQSGFPVKQVEDDDLVHNFLKSATGAAGKKLGDRIGSFSLDSLPSFGKPEDPETFSEKSEQENSLKSFPDKTQQEESLPDKSEGNNLSWMDFFFGTTSSTGNNSSACDSENGDDGGS